MKKRKMNMMLASATLSGAFALLSGCNGGSGGPIGPDNTSKIVFSSTRDGNSEIYAMNPDGSNQQRLTDNSAFDVNPALSSNRFKVAFESDRDDANGDIYSLDINSKAVRRLAASPATDRDPTFDQQGLKIAFASNRGEGVEIFTMNADGSNVQQLTNTPPGYAGVEWPAFSPDGRRLMYVRVYVDAGGGDLYSISINGGVETRLSTENCAFPSYSPDGKYIAFSVFGNGNSDIYIMNADGSNVKRLTQTPGSETETSFSPDGKKIAFAYTGAGKTNIYTMNVDGSQVTQITQENDASSPSWK